MSKRPWLCPLVSLAIAVGVALLFGLTFWTIFLIALFLTCPIMAVWTYIMGQRPLPIPLDPTPVTRGMTLNWIAPWYDSIWCPAFGLGSGFATARWHWQDCAWATVCLMSGVGPVG